MGRKRQRPCSACRREQVAARVAAADPSLDQATIAQAIEATATSHATLRELAAALADGPDALVAGAPGVVGRLVAELVARGSVLPLPSCAVCGRGERPLIRVGSRGVCPRCRSHQLAEPCACCGNVRRVYGPDADGSPRCWSCHERPKRRCGCQVPVPERDVDQEAP